MCTSSGRNEIHVLSSSWTHYIPDLEIQTHGTECSAHSTSFSFSEFAVNYILSGSSFRRAITIRLNALNCLSKKSCWKSPLGMCIPLWHFLVTPKYVVKGLSDCVLKVLTERYSFIRAHGNRKFDTNVADLVSCIELSGTFTGYLLVLRSRMSIAERHLKSIASFPVPDKVTILSLTVSFLVCRVRSVTLCSHSIC